MMICVCLLNARTHTHTCTRLYANAYNVGIRNGENATGCFQDRQRRSGVL